MGQYSISGATESKLNVNKKPQQVKLAGVILINNRDETKLCCYNIKVYGATTSMQQPKMPH
jgi:hypothetical protein